MQTSKSSIPQDVEWSIATRVQSEKDVIVMTDMGRAKPLDPVLPPGMDPTLIAQLGIDATIPERIPNFRYKRITFSHAENIELDMVITDGITIDSQHESEDQPLISKVEAFLRDRQAVYYMKAIDRFSTRPHRIVVQAMGRLYESCRLARDEVGRYLLIDGVEE